MDPIVTGSLIAGGSSIVGNFIGANLNKKNRDWQEYMSNTAHQRQVDDLKSAGLNPLLSGTGGQGASVPSVPSFKPDFSGVGEAAFNAIAAKQQKRLNDKALEAQDTNIDVNKKNLEILNYNLDVAKTRKGFVGEQPSGFDNTMKFVSQMVDAFKGNGGQYQETYAALTPYLKALAEKVGLDPLKFDPTQVPKNPKVNDKPKGKMDWLDPKKYHYEGGAPASPGRNLGTNRGD